MRAALGYPKPFSINYVEIGNEDFLNNGIPSYIGKTYILHYTHPLLFSLFSAEGELADLMERVPL